MSTLITRIKLKLGLLNLATPFENINKTIVTILNTITTPTFSIYLPVKETLNVSLNDLEVLEKNNDYMKVLLPDFKTRKLLYVFDIEYNLSVLIIYLNLRIVKITVCGGIFRLESRDDRVHTVDAEFGGRIDGVYCHPPDSERVAYLILRAAENIGRSVSFEPGPDIKSARFLNEVYLIDAAVREGGAQPVVEILPYKIEYIVISHIIICQSPR